MSYPRTRSWAREQTIRSSGTRVRAGTRSSTPECKPRAPPRPGSAHFEQDLAKFPRGSARLELDAGSYRRLLVPDSGKGSAPEVEGRSPPSSRPVLHPREAAQPERQRGAHPPGHRDALCLPSFSLRRDRERDDREQESEQAATGSVFSPQGGCPGGVAGPDPGASVHQAQQPAPWPRKLGHLVALSPQGCLRRVLSAGHLSAAVAEHQSNRPPMPDKLVVPRPGDAPPWSQAGRLIRWLQFCSGCGGLGSPTQGIGARLPSRRRGLPESQSCRAREQRGLNSAAERALRVPGSTKLAEPPPRNLGEAIAFQSPLGIPENDSKARGTAASRGRRKV